MKVHNIGLAVLCAFAPHFALADQSSGDADKLFQGGHFGEARERNCSTHPYLCK